MTVYVDGIHAAIANCRLEMSRMIADTEGELHAAAQAIGLSRRWFHGSYYEVGLTKRAEAVNNGAREISMRSLTRMLQYRYVLGKLPTPDQAEQFHLNHQNLTRAAGEKP